MAVENIDFLNQPINVNDPYVQMMVCTVVDLIIAEFDLNPKRSFISQIDVVDLAYQYMSRQEDLTKDDKQGFAEFLEHFGGDQAFKAIARDMKEFIFMNEPAEMRQLKKRPAKSDEKFDYLYLKETVEVVRQVFREEFKKMRNVAPGLLPRQVSLDDLRFWLDHKQVKIDPLSSPEALLKKYIELIATHAKKCETKLEHLKKESEVSIEPLDWYRLSVWGREWYQLFVQPLVFFRSRFHVFEIGYSEDEDKVFKKDFLGTVRRGDEKENLIFEYFKEVNSFIFQINASKWVGGIPEMQAALYFFLKKKASVGRK